MVLPSLLLSLGLTAAVVQASFQLKDATDYEVNRKLLERNYPAFETFHGSMHAGLMPAALTNDDDDDAIGHDDDDDDYSSYFFWLFQPHVDDNSDEDDDVDTTTNAEFRNDTLLIWFNGGPGCSSLVGNMGENGPVGTAKFRPGIPRFDNHATDIDAPLVENPFAWTKKSAVLYVDQPGGVSFSTASSEWTVEESLKRTEDDIADAFYPFLQNILTTFDLTKQKLYLTGESYAGMYIPSIARTIHRNNKHIIANDEGFHSPKLNIVNLRGLAIGNGSINVNVLGGTVIDYAWWHGMIDLQTKRSLHVKWEECLAGKIVDESEPPFHPFTTPGECGIWNAVLEASGGNFYYEVTTYDTYPALMEQGGTISRFFNDPDVRESLNAPSLIEHPLWLACIPGSGRRRRLESSDHHNERGLLYLDNDKPLTVVPYIAELLDDAEIDILLYNGDLDLACNAQSTQLSLEAMEWSGKEMWNDPTTTKWHEWQDADGQPSGHTKKYRNLEFVAVYNSGHFVPINQARHSLDMIGRLLDGKPLGDKELPMFPSRGAKQSPVVQTVVSTEEVGPTTDGSTHGFSLLVGLCGFLLGILTSYVISKRSASRQTSSAPSSFDTTEATPLNRT